MLAQTDGISVNPYRVRKALGNTSIPIGYCPEDKLLLPEKGLCKLTSQIY